MRAFRRFGKLGLTFAITVVFLAVSLLPNLAPPAYAQGAPSPPLPVPEDPLAQKTEKAIDEITVDVDVRDGHPTVRVVDIWGPGRTPLLVRSYTNTPSYSSSSSGGWQFNEHMDLAGTATGGVGLREPDGNRARFTYSYTRWSADSSHRWDVYTTTIGTASTMEIHFNCVPGLPEGGSVRSQSQPPLPGRRRIIRPQPGPHPTPRLRPVPRGQSAPVRPLSAPECTEDGTPMVYMPKGVNRRYAGGLIQEARDANGNVVTFTPTALPQQIWTYVAQVRDPVGRTISYAYEQDRQECVVEGELGCTDWRWHYRVRTATDPYGQIATYTYTGGLISRVDTPGGQATLYAYGAGGRLEQVTNSRGWTTTIQWSMVDGYPRVTRVTRADGTFTSYAYTLAPGGQRVGRTVVTNARGHATTYDFYSGADENYFGNVDRVTNHLGHVTQFAYDARHNVTNVVDPRGNATVYSYNSRNKITQVVQAAGTLNLVTTYTWDENDNLLQVRVPRGINTNYTYDARHNLTSVRRAVGTADESLTQYTYNTWGGVTSMVDPRNYTTTYTYTARRQLERITPPAGGATTFFYASNDNQYARTDGNGRTWSTGFNSRRLVTDITDPSNNVVRFEYDANGNRTRIIDARNFSTWFAYDSRDRLVTITNALNGSTHYVYDGVSNLTRITNARGHPTNLAYDAANRMTQSTDALGQITTYQYDQAGSRTQMLDRRGITHTYSYDQANRLTQVFASSQTIAYTYDPNGNRVALQDATGATSYTYDNLDRLTRTIYPNGRSVQVTYDRASNRTSMTNPDAQTMTYTYDAANRLIYETLAGTLTWTINYDGAGNRTQLLHPNGTRTAYFYFPNNWLRGTAHYDPAGVFQGPGSVEYAYDANGNRITQCDLSGCAGLTYDALNRLTSAAYQGGYGTWSWTYDAVGNRIQQTAPAGVTNYGYDANNRLTSAGATTYTYDGNGNLTSSSAGQTFTWDAFNRMTQATGPGGVVTNTYNGDGLKVRRVGPDGTTLYYHDGIRSIYETDTAGNRLNQLDRDIFGNLLSWREASGARWYVAHDGLGSTAALTDSSGAILFSMLYDAWGNPRAGNHYGKYRFTGAEHDAATGFYHMGARFYDSVTGRWLTEDPLRVGALTLRQGLAVSVAADRSFDPSSLNLYAYAAANPVNYIDPTGLAQISVQGIGDAVRTWVREFGVDEALRLVREAWAKITEGIDKLNQIMDYMRSIGTSWYYVDYNVTAIFVTGGLIKTRDGSKHPYIGVSFNFSLGPLSASQTWSVDSVTKGWNIAAGGAFIAAFQGGGKRGCVSCNYIELGWGTPGITGFALFYVF